MHLVQIFLPVYDNAGVALPRELYDEVRRELVDRFRGLTAYSRAPAKGLWADGAQVEKDDIVVYEVMVEPLDPGWWSRYRKTLEQRFAQDELMVRALETTRL
ncbi:MAG TPA: hypothetical protein VHM00_09710 [Caldimonas sp.]|jgi:hypothetical protein|nr:hypothetical protein [Caldimonas sp.]HEX2541343.1 hypothetical protein [Caldimonas sp.]